MLGRIVEIATDNRHLALKRGFLEIRSGDDLVGRVPLDDITAVIVNGHGLTTSANLLTALAERGIAFVLCGSNHRPAAYLLGLDGHHVQAARMEAQLSARKLLCQRLWRGIVRAKIANQAAVLTALGRKSNPVAALVAQVRAGDPRNIEAQAARRYWPLAFGSDFRRDRSADGVNAMLNYSYTVLRAATARAVVAAGLHPSRGLHHRSGSNPMRLVDDLVEPFRPLADAVILGLIKTKTPEVNTQTKPLLARVAYLDMESQDGVSPAHLCMHRLATSLAQVFLSERRDLDLPRPLPLALGKAVSGQLTV